MMASASVCQAGRPPKVARLNPGRAPPASMQQDLQPAPRGAMSSDIALLASRRVGHVDPRAASREGCDRRDCCSCAGSLDTTCRRRPHERDRRACHGTAESRFWTIICSSCSLIAGCAEMRRVARAVLERVAEEYLADDRYRRGIFLAPDARLQLIVLNVEIDRGGPPQHETPANRVPTVLAGCGDLRLVPGP